jgi:hypothetical protein
MTLVIVKFYKFLMLVVALILLHYVVLFSPMNIGVVLLSLLFLSTICKDVSLIYACAIFVCLFVIFFAYTYVPPLACMFPLVEYTYAIFVWAFRVIVSAHKSSLRVSVLLFVLAYCIKSYVLKNVF